MQRDISVAPGSGSIRMCLLSRARRPRPYCSTENLSPTKTQNQRPVCRPDRNMSLRKGAQDEWRTAAKTQWREPPTIIIRYTDVLLMHAEAENRTRRTGCKYAQCHQRCCAPAPAKTTRDNTAAYPALALSDQNTMRSAVRKERRVSFAWEGRRFFDLLRWDGWMPEKAFSHDYYAFPTKTGWAGRYGKSRRLLLALNPEIDECGFADFADKFDAGKIVLEGKEI